MCAHTVLTFSQLDTYVCMYALCCCYHCCCCCWCCLSPSSQLTQSQGRILYQTTSPKVNPIFFCAYYWATFVRSHPNTLLVLAPVMAASARTHTCTQYTIQHTHTLTTSLPLPCWTRIAPSLLQRVNSAAHVRIQYLFPLCGEQRSFIYCLARRRGTTNQHMLRKARIVHLCGYQT